MSLIEAEGLTKLFRQAIKAPGRAGAVKHLFHPCIGCFAHPSLFFSIRDNARCNGEQCDVIKPSAFKLIGSEGDRSLTKGKHVDEQSNQFRRNETEIMRTDPLPSPTWKRLGFVDPPDEQRSGQGVGIVILDSLCPHATLQHLGHRVTYVSVHDDLSVTCHAIAFEPPPEQTNDAGIHGLMSVLLLGHAPFELGGFCLTPQKGKEGAHRPSLDQKKAQSLIVETLRSPLS